MGGEGVVHAVKVPGVNYGLCAAHTLLRGLEYELHRAVQLIAHPGQQRGRADADGGVPVVSAGVHHARRDGGEALFIRQVGGVLRLVHAEGVDIKAQRYSRPFAAVQRRNNAGEAAGRVRQELRVRAVLLCPLIMGGKRLLRGEAHAGVPLADVGACKHLVAQLGQAARKDGACAHFEPAGLGIVMKVTAYRRQLRQERLSARSYRIIHTNLRISTRGIWS